MLDSDIDTSRVYPQLECGVGSFRHPLIPDENSFNPCLITNLILIVSASYFGYGVIRLYKTVKRRQFGSYAPKNTGLIHYFRSILVLLHSLSSVYLLTFVSIHERFADNKIVSFSLLSLALVFVVTPLHFIEVCHYATPCDTLVTLWPLLTSLELLVFYQDYYTNWAIIKSVENPYQVWTCEVFLVVTSVFIFVLEYFYWKPSHELMFDLTKHGRQHELKKPNFVQRLTFTWMNELIVNTYKTQVVEQVDLPNNPIKLSTENASTQLKKYWKGSNKKSQLNLLSSLIKAFGMLLLYSFLLEFSTKCLSFAQPQLLRIFIRYFNEDSPTALKGIVITFLMFANNMAQKFIYNHYSIINLEAGMSCRSSLNSLIYNKSLKLSSSARMKTSSGDIINLMSVDVNRIQNTVMDLSVVFLAPFDVILCLSSLWPLLGKPTLAGVGVMCLLIPLNSIVVRISRGLNVEQMKLKDARTSIANEIWTSIKSLKLFSWESAILEKLTDARNNKELANLVKIRIINQCTGFIWASIPFLVSFTTFTVFALTQSVPLTPDIVFPALALLDLLSHPLLAFPNFINSMIEASVSVSRINEFLLSDELDDSVKYLEGVEVGKVSVKVENTDFLWSETENSTEAVALRNVNFSAKKGEITAVVGKVGSGKSALLYGLLGQLVVRTSSGVKKQSSIDIHGTIAYCAQQPWIMNASLKENVLFGHRYDEDFYNKTIDACQLLPDIKILPDGDNTQVGEKGVSLSGGQKARLALARAVYSRSDIYLLDDILSAVDSHVGKNITDKVLGVNGLLSTKTIILCTNSISVLKYAAKITLVQNGQIVEESGYNDITAEAHPDLFSLLEEFDNREAKEGDRENEANTEKLPKLEENDEGGSSSEEELASSASLRRASVATYDWDPLKKLLPNIRSGQINEVSEKGKVKWSIYYAYAKACSIPGIVVWFTLLVSATMLTLGSSYWLKHWTESNSKSGTNDHVWKFIVVYALIGFSSRIMSVIKGAFSNCYLAINASKRIHSDMASRVIRAPMVFFERTPVGRIMNRFTSDINKIDAAIPYTFSGFFNALVSTVLRFGIIVITMPFYIFVIVLLSLLYVYYQIYYIAISRELKRLVSISRSPIYAHLGETLNGLDTIRAFRQDQRFVYIFNSNSDFNLKSLYMLRSINRWLAFRLQVIGALGVWTASTLAVYSLTTASPLTASMAGFIMTNALEVTESLKVLVRLSADVETNIVAVERCLEYINLPVEEDEEKLKKCSKPPLTWPMAGGIKFNEYSTRYRANLDLILRKISFEIKPGEKVGVVGRTGAGKSSLALAIFRIIEAAEGNISIDGLNTQGMTLKDLRSKLSIIPQDSQLMEGTIRQNLDPFNYYTDEEVWKALELAHLKDHIMSLTNETKDPTNKNKKQNDVEVSKLMFQVREGGSNFSSGQRQLMSLARVLLRMKDSRILVLDEATAAVDVQTDKIIQETIRKELSDKTIITIAHRLETVMDSDKIVTLDHGEIKEFDTPENLLKNESGIFYNLCLSGGYI